MRFKTAGEIWKQVRGYEGAYEISNLGSVRSVARKDSMGRRVRERLLRLGKNPEGYLYAPLCVAGRAKQIAVHRMVLEAFDRPPQVGEEARHRNRQTSDNRATNLRWGTHLENETDKIRHGTRLFGESAPWSKLSVADVERIREQVLFGASTYSVARTFGISQSHSSDIATGKKWAHVL